MKKDLLVQGQGACSTWHHQASMGTFLKIGDDFFLFPLHPLKAERDSVLGTQKEEEEGEKQECRAKLAAPRVRRASET